MRRLLAPRMYLASPTSHPAWRDLQERRKQGFANHSRPLVRYQEANRTPEQPNTPQQAWEGHCCNINLSPDPSDAFESTTTPPEASWRAGPLVEDPAGGPGVQVWLSPGDPDCL